MNRALRRAAARQKPLQPPKVIELPGPLDEWSVFNNIHTILKKLEYGHIEHAGNKPVFLDETGKWFEICPALSGWISCWERVDRHYNLEIDQDPLAKLHNKLNYGMLLAYDDILAAMKVVDIQRSWFRKLPRAELRSLAKTEQIALFLEK